MTTQDLLTAWRDATRAAELAARLAEIAAEQADQADERLLASTEIAEQAEQAAAAAERAAKSARAAAQRASELVAKLRGNGLRTAGETLEHTQAIEVSARDAYHGAEQEALRRHTGEAQG